MLWVLEMGEPQRDMLVSGKYRILDPLGSGGMGAVYSATHVEVGRKVALKFLRSDLTKTPGTVARFRREAAAAGSIGHENILEVFDVGEMSDGTPFIVMELLEGEALARLLNREKKLPPWRACHVAAQMLSALGAAHNRGIVHRDLKPENVFLTTRAGQRDFVKVLDFGISAISNPTEGTPRLTETGDVLGTPPYMAPEQARGEPVIDHRADLWAAGVVLFEMLTGQLPFPGQNGLQVISRILTEPVPRPSKHVADLPDGLDELVLKALDKDKTLRFQSAGDFYEALVPFLLESARGRKLEFTPATPVTWTVDGGVDAAATRALKRTWWSRHGGRTAKIAAGTAAALLAVLAIAFYTTSDPAERAPAREPETVETAPAKTAVTPAPEMVTLTFAASPADAQIRVDGALLEGNPASLTVRRGGAAVRLQVSAPGHSSVDRWFAPDRDRAVDIALVREGETAAAAPPATEETTGGAAARRIKKGGGRAGGGGGRGASGGGGTDGFPDLLGPR
jgi:serine/threonine-protein kinase